MKKTQTLIATENQTQTQTKANPATTRGTKPEGIQAPMLPSGRAALPKGNAPIEKGKPEHEAGKIGKALNEAEAKGKAKGKKAKAKDSPIGRTYETPRESLKLADIYRPSFSEKCANWLVLGASGQMRVVAPQVIALHIMQGKTRYIFNEIPAELRGTEEYKALREKAAESLKSMRDSWRKLDADTKAKHLKAAKPWFNTALREFLKKTAPLKKAFSDKRFSTSKAEVHCTKKGIVHVGMRATHQPELVTAK